jgi:hypothetical protein
MKKNVRKSHINYSHLFSMRFIVKGKLFLECNYWAAFICFCGIKTKILTLRERRIVEEEGRKGEPVINMPKDLIIIIYSCCSHLEHRASVKRFVSLQFLNLRHSVGLLGRVISPSQGRYLTRTQNKHKQTSMLRVRFEPTIPAFERAKTVHALDPMATVIGAQRS